MANLVSVLIPGYNEAGNVKELLERVAKGLRAISAKGECVFVDDGSDDGTLEALKEARKRHPFLRIVRHARRKGLTEALKTGFSAVKGDIILFLPADLESRPDEDIPLLYKKINDGAGLDIVCGWRQGRKGFKRVASWCYNTVSKALFGTRVHDLNWVKAMRKEVVDSIELRSDWHRYIAILAAARGYKLGEVKVRAYQRKYGSSKYGFARLFIGALDLLVIKFYTSFMEKPMRLFSVGGLFLAGLGALGGFYLLFLKLSTGAIGTRLPLLFLVVLLLILGAQFFAFGLVSEMLATLQERVRKR